MNRSVLVGVGLVLAVVAVAAGVGWEIGAGWGLVAAGVLAVLLLVFVVEVDNEDGGQ